MRVLFFRKYILFGENVMTFKMKSTWDFWQLLLDDFSLFIEDFKKSGNLVSKLNISISKILEFSSKIDYVFFQRIRTNQCYDIKILPFRLGF